MSRQHDTEASPAVSHAAEPLWKLEDVCHFLKMGRTWVRKQMAVPASSGGLPHYRLGRAVRFDPKQVREWWRGHAAGPERTNGRP